MLYFWFSHEGAAELRTARCRTWFALGLAILCGEAAMPWPLLLDPLPRPPLHPNESIERRMAGGETDEYSLVAVPPARLLVTVDQQGIDVEVAVRREDGQTLLAVDGPTRRDGLESLLLPREATGRLRLVVRAPSPGAAAGAYVLRLVELGEATPAERETVDAERLMTAAAAHNREGTAESLQLGLREYRDASRRWHALHRPHEEAWSALAAAEIDAMLGRPKEAIDLFAQALTHCEQLTDDLGQEAAWRGIGLARTALGEPVAAVAAQRRAVALAHALGRPYLEAEARNDLGLALHAQGELREARGLYEQALAMFRQAGERGAWEAAVLQNLAAVEIGLGEAETALERHQQVLATQRALGDTAGEAQTLNNLGVLYGNLGELGKALDAYTRALAIFRRSGDRLWQATLLHNRGSAYYGLGDFQRARADLEQALAMRRDAGDRAGEVRSEINLGQALFQLGETAAALDLGARAAAVAGAAADRAGEMLARLLVAKMKVASGAPQEALAELPRADELARLLDDHLGEISVLQVTGQARLAQRQAAEAARLLGQAVELSRTAKSPHRTVAALTSLAAAERMLDRPAAARVRAEEAIALIESLRTAEPDPDLRASFLASQREAFELDISLLMELDGQAPGGGYARQALEVSERERARSLLDLLEEAKADIRAGAEPSLRDRERALQVKLTIEASRRAGRLRVPGAEQRQHSSEDGLRALLDQLADVQAEIRRQSPRYAALTQPTPATSHEIQSLLDGDTMLLEYALGDTSSFLWAVDRESVTGFTLPRRAEIEEAAHAVCSRLGAVGPGGAGDRATREPMAKLSLMLLGPIRGRLGSRRLIVVGDGDLHYLPFGLLPDPAPHREGTADDGGGAGGGRGAGAPLLLAHEIVYAPSASVLAELRRSGPRTPAPGVVAVLADPVFDAADPRVAGAGARQRPPAPAASSGFPAGVRAVSGEPFSRLPWTRREAQAIAAIAPAGEALLALDFQASRDTVLSPALARYRIVHLATHGIIDSRTPALSGLMLSRVSEQGGAREGFLGLGDIYNLHLGADLVVLSGCETALGKQVRGEGLVGLTQGFLYAGAKQIVASLWRVEDRATAELMSRFYRGLLLEGRPPATALRLAQLAIRRDKRWRLPYYWSGFVAQGDWR